MFSLVVEFSRDVEDKRDRWASWMLDIRLRPIALLDLISINPSQGRNHQAKDCDTNKYIMQSEE